MKLYGTDVEHKPGDLPKTADTALVKFAVVFDTGTSGISEPSGLGGFKTPIQP